MQLASIVFAAALAAFGTQNMETAAADDPGLLRDCVVTFIYDTNIPADLPAQQGGVIRSVNVKEGDHVAVDAILAQVDDSIERTNEEASIARLEMAKEEWGNDINVRYAKMASEVYKFRLKQAMEASEKVPDAYTYTELKVLELQYRQYMLQTEQAEHEQNLAGMSVRVREAEKKLASYELGRRVIRSPVEGVVVEVFPRVGAWVRAGDPIARVVQLDRLRIEGYLQYGPISPADVDGKPVTVQVQLAKGQVGTFQGRIDSIDPIIEGGNRFRVRAEVINQKIGEHWALMGGMIANMQIHWQQ
ncbi:MAG: HlyD family efflux transporter periplasmic adaptor subunit [Pirellulaceae bacterium]|jgi:multidrug efflux pump subunit AcrA (membrane-fusion protein)|nr:HlyD family efflux transporter periplasmic adaptor subunit [Thermoguttaceae bacterium]MDI9442840.1 HlyD family efflux transporter periplasmic adaptor subunit [Planctomycetota bacterium]NLZ02444.1 HlyD family efflux transporter periplasmic adaptor subunit [Pirellulaceae bacterium]